MVQLSEDLELLSKNIVDFSSTQNTLDQKLKAAQAQLDSTFSNLEECTAKHSSQLKEFENLKKMIDQIETEHKDALKNNAGLSATLNSAKDQLNQCKFLLDSMKEKKPSTSSGFLGLILGHVNVRLWKKADVLAFKEEYKIFKESNVIVYILFPLIQLFFPIRFIGTVHQLWLLYYYTALAVRENILKANGSDIKAWWINHHYLSMAVSVLTLLWPASEAYDRLAPQFLFFLAVQGIIMVFQNKYQSRRQYVRRSLGRARDIDIDSSETISEKPADLTWLLPLLFITYGCEIFLGFRLVLAFFSDPHWTILGIGALFIILGLGNGATTFYIIRKKKEKVALARRYSVVGASKSQ